jgi:integrase
MRLTKGSIGRAAPPTGGRKERFMHDDAVSGLGVRVTAGGAKSWIFEGRVRGRSRRITLGRWPDLTVALARRRALEMRAAIARGEDPHRAHLERKHEATFGGLADRYMAEHARVHKRERSWRENERQRARYIPPAWDGRRLSDIARADVERLHARVGQEHGRYAANHLVRLLRHIFNKAADWGLAAGANPAARVKMFDEPRRERFLSPVEVGRVNEALAHEPDWRWRAYFPLSLMLGTRRSELLAMRWADIDLDRRTWRIPVTKTGNPHLLPLPAPAVAILIDLPSRGTNEWVFPSDSACGHLVEPGGAWRRIRRDAGVADVRVHDLRHTLASWLVAQGFNLPLIGRALNHTRTTTTARYAHLAMDPLRAALEQTAALMVPAKDGAAGES